MDTQVVKILSVLVLAAPLLHGQRISKMPGQVAGPDGRVPAFVEESSHRMTHSEKLAWMQRMRQKLPIATRKIGPFGLPQDPRVEVAKPVQDKPKEGAFLKAIAAIKVNTVMPAEGKFTIGAREFRKGDVLPVIWGHRQFNIKIVKVKTDTILFKNTDTGEFVRRNLNTLPKGMKKNAQLDSVPGVIPANKKDKTPLNLDDDPVTVSSE